MIKQLFQDVPRKRIIIFLLILSGVVTITYLNHFQNDFHFDDSHTITNNLFIRDIHNIPTFFKDGTTFSSLPQNQSYRPVVSTSLALDYWLGKGYNVFYFHLSSFILFLLQGFLMFFFIFKIFDNSFRNTWNFYLAAFTTTLYLLHPANAETINYIIARSDLQSTFFVILAFTLYLFSPFSRKYFLYLLPIGLGVLAKPPAVMFAPMLFFYVWLFEIKAGLGDFFNKEKRKVIFSSLWKTMPAFIFCAGLYFFVDIMTPKTWIPGGTSAFHYLITQPFVILHYFTTFFLPLGLNADTDWTPLESIMDYRFFTGSAFVLVLIFIAYKTSKIEKYRPVSFGILWFFLALIPTSSIIPLSEVMNDHRVFFPYVGLAIAVCWSAGLILMRYWNKRSVETSGPGTAILLVAALILCGYAYGTYQRNKVWRTEESLWYDVTVKSPRNGRGLMNYGLDRMTKGDYETAEKYFTKAMEFSPRYHYLLINMAILKSARGDKAAAETYFKRALQYGGNSANSYYYYGRFLNEQSRFDEAINELTRALEISPADLNTRLELMKAYQNSSNWEKLNELAESTVSLEPGNAEAKSYLASAKNRKGNLELLEDETKSSPTAEKFLILSLEYYQRGRYQQCVDAATEATRLKPDYFEAYNNIGSAYNAMHEYAKAIPALEKAIEIKPDLQLAKNNLAYAKKQLEQLSAIERLVGSNRSAANYFNLGLKLYRQHQYSESIEAYYAALKLNPEYADAYNNLGVVYIELKEWDKAIDACTKALKLQPDYKLAAGNLNWAKDQKAKGK